MKSYSSSGRPIRSGRCSSTSSSTPLASSVTAARSAASSSIAPTTTRYRSIRGRISRVHREECGDQAGARRIRAHDELRRLFQPRGTDVFQQRALDPRILYRAVRHDVRSPSTHRSPIGRCSRTRATWNIRLERSRRRSWAVAPAISCCWTAYRFTPCADSTRCTRRRVGIDHNFLVKVLSDGLTIRDIGGPVYHLNHLGSYR